MEYYLGTMPDIDDICDLIGSAIKEMEKNRIFQWDDLYPAREDYEKNGYARRGQAQWRKGLFYLMEKIL